MGLFRPSRAQRGPDPYYHWKAILFSVGAALGLGAMVTGRDWLILVAVPILVAGMGLRWLPGGTARREAEEEAEEEEEHDPGDEHPAEPPPPA